MSTDKNSPAQVDTLDDPIIELFMLAVMSTMREPTLPEFRAKLLALLVEARLNELDHILFTDDPHQFSKWLMKRKAQLEKQREAGNA